LITLPPGSFQGPAGGKSAALLVGNLPPHSRLALLRFGQFGGKIFDLPTKFWYNDARLFGYYVPNLASVKQARGFLLIQDE
jgi:hypothetical protein